MFHPTPSVEFEHFLSGLPVEHEYLQQEHIPVFKFPEKKICLQWIPREITKIEQIPDINFETILVKENIWLNQTQIVKSRILSLLGLNQSIAARKCMVQRIDKLKANAFYNQYHLLGGNTGYIHLALILNGKIISVMSFSKSRIMTDSEVYYRSYELVRFASCSGFTVTGGLQKLLKFFITNWHAVHIMTYIDTDWGQGKAFLKAGFKLAPDPKSNLENNTQPKKTNSIKLILDLRNNE